MPAGRRKRDEVGAVTAEAALGIGVLAAVAVGLAWMLSLGVVAIRAQDAARESARALARGDTSTQALEVARQVAPDGSQVRTATVGRLVRVTVRSPVRGPGGIFAFIGPVVVSGEAVAALEAPDG